MTGKQFSATQTHRAMPIDGNLEPNDSYYVFNAENEEGFVIVAGDDRLPDILGYSEHGTLNPDKAPDNVKWLLDYYTKVVKSLSIESDTESPSMRSAKPAIRPMITTTWGQAAPYSDLCPVQNGEHCLTGCVATALAQVINYNRWPQGPTNSVAAYKPQRLGINMPQLEPTTFNWDNMTNEDVARLMLYCGQAVEMDYGIEESGASSSMQSIALIKVFGYSQTAHEVYRSSYSEDDWDDILYNELAESRPVVYDGDASGGGGHAFVVHGYKDGMFYINWGWDGNEDGYFRLTGLSTSSGDFNANQVATISIQSPTGELVNRPKVVVKEVNYWGHRFVHRTSDGTFPSIELSTRLVSDLSESKNIQIGLGLYDENGMVKVLSKDSKYFAVNEEKTDNVSFTIDKDINDGTYRVVPISRISDADDWIADANSSDYYLEISIDGQWMRLRTFQLSLDEQTIEDMAVASIDGISYSFYKRKGENCATILSYDSGKPSGKVDIPNNITFEDQSYLIYRIEDDVFVNCPNLTSLSVASINAPYIDNCQNLTKIDLREGVCTMKHGISACNNLVSIEFPRSLTTIEHGPELCDKLESMSFASQQQITFIFTPKWTAEYLPALRSVCFMSEYPPVIMFQDQPLTVNPAVTIHIPKGAKASYENSIWSGWNIVDDLIQPKTDGVVWGYCDGDQISDVYSYDDCGENNGEYALHVPAEMLAPYTGMTISHIQFYQPGDMCDYVFITKPGTDYIVKQEAIKVENSWMDVELTHPYTITGDELYVGIGRKGRVVTMLSSIETKIPEGFWFRTMGTDTNNDMIPGQWKYVPAYLSSFNNPIPLRFVISGDNLPTDMAVMDVSVQNDGTSQKGQLTINNRSKESIDKFTVNWDVDSSRQGSETFETSLNPGRSTTVSFNIPEGLEGRYHKLGYSISEVNGIADAISANSTGVINFKTAGGHPDDGPQVVNNVTLGSGQLWWNNHDVHPGHGQDMMIGTGMVNVRYDAAIYVPSGLIGGSGTTIDGLSFFRNTLAIRNVTVWVSTYLPETEGDADIEILDIPNNQLSHMEFQFHQVAFRQPHVIPEGGLYVGYSFDITEDLNNAGLPLDFTNTIRTREESLWSKVRDDSHRTNWSDFSSEYGDLKAQILFGGGNFNQDAARLTNLTSVSVVVGGSGMAEAILLNDGANSIKNVCFTVSGDKGQTYEVKTNVDVSPFYYGKVSFSLNADAQQGTDEKTIIVAKVNGRDNTAPKGSSMNCSLYTLTEKPVTTAVLEDKTGTVYGNGTVGMTVRGILAEKYGDKLLIMVPHHLDIMELNEYSELFRQTYTSVAYINRKGPVDIYRGSYNEKWGIEKDIQNALDATVPGSVEVRAVWADKNKNGINIYTETLFGMDVDKHPFQLGYVVLEDGLSGTGPEWVQTNQMSGNNYEEDPVFDKWAAMPWTIDGLTYDNVPVAAWEPYKGIEESIPQSIKAGEKITDLFIANIEDNIHIRNKDNLSVVALLLDKQNGTIINAAKCKIDAYGTGITSLSTNEQAFDVYNLQGHKVRHHVNSLNSLPKGIYIVNGKKIVK